MVMFSFTSSLVSDCSLTKYKPIIVSAYSLSRERVKFKNKTPGFVSDVYNNG